jgi:hypothetical protein
VQSPTPEDVRRALADFDATSQKIVAGMLTVMMRDPERVRDREWVSEQLAQMTLLAGEFEAESPQAGVRAVEAFLKANAERLLRASLLLFQRVGLDLAPRAAEGLTFEQAIECGLAYLPSSKPIGDEGGRDLGEQPLARLMAECELEPADLVAASSEQLTHKMVKRAMKGRRLTAHAMGKVLRAWESATSAKHRAADLFDYEP